MNRFCVAGGLVLLLWPAFAGPQVIQPAPAASTFEFTDFSSKAGLNILGDASLYHKGLYLTPAMIQKAGSVWLTGRQPIADGFDTSFQFRLDAQGGIGGADGFAFVLQNAGPTALAGKGSAGGFAMGNGYNNKSYLGIPRSMAIFFDTFQNKDADDPSDNYIAICTNGGVQNMRWPPPRVAYTSDLKTNLKDGKVHTARITYVFPNLSVYLDDLKVPVLTSPVDLAIAVDPNGTAYVGFTASTGQGFQTHEILSWSFSAGQASGGASGIANVTSDISFLFTCLPNHTFCTPEGPVITEKTPGHFHVVLPANMKWGAGIPNPSEQGVVLKNVRGTVCWDLKAGGATGCSGPTGSTITAGNDFVSPGRHAGSLLITTLNGETRFSVNGPKTTFDQHEGFFEFDVQLQPVEIDH